MSGKILEISCKSGHIKTLLALAEESSARVLSTYEPMEDNELASVRLFIEIEDVQRTLDKVQASLPATAEPIILLSPVDAQIGEHDNLMKGEAVYFLATREELFSSISNDSQFDRTFVLLVVLSTIVASIGIAENNVAVVIGAMVIAPLLGPNLGLALGSVLGDRELIRTAVITNGLGLTITVITSVLIAVIWSPNLDSGELLSRTQVQYSSVFLALASGIAAVVSLTSRLPNTLVGVMVAVALVPPATVFGMMIGIQKLGISQQCRLTIDG
ncbi:MAG: putative hydrophobic protein (TIGR00341 family) [Arenicella sp.]|jgi:uncharacterized hydrophobic protein (TIGR00341 family)